MSPGITPGDVSFLALQGKLVPPKAVRNLSDVQAAYLAGLIDGEGTVTLSRRHRNERRQLVVSIVSTERSLVDWALQATGVGKITRKRVTSDKHAPGLTYSVSNRQALELLRQVSPYLHSYKKTRSLMALSEYIALTPRNGRYRGDLGYQRDRFERAFLAVHSRSEPHSSS